MHFFRKNNKYVYVMTSRNTCLPRALTKHLDAEPDHNVRFWITDYELKHGVKVVEKQPLLSKWVERVEAYLAERASKKSPKTQSDHRRMLMDFVIPFFTQLHGLGDPNQWPPVAPKLAAYIRDQTGSEFQIQKANSALRAFWEWLHDEQQVLGNSVLRLKKPVRTAVATPLLRTVSPEEVLAFSARAPRYMALLALCGYFFSLRPQEVFALRVSDFRAGSTARGFECSKVMRKFYQFDGLVVNVTRQRDQTGQITPPKAFSKGWVSCFDERAARRLVELIRGQQDLFSNRNDYLFDHWKKFGIPNITLKDLRRASLYHLGHIVGMEFAGLSAHARHAKPETTMLYLRRPEEEAEGLTLDLDA